MKTNYSRRKLFIQGFILLVALIYVSKLFYIQVIDKKYAAYAESNVLRKITRYPARGLIFDRNQNLLVYNESVYDVMIIPRQVKSFDTTEFLSLVDTDRLFLEDQIQKAKNYSRYKASVLIPQLSKESHAYLKEKLYKYPGFYVQKRSIRKYPSDIAAHTLGYIGEVNAKQLQDNAYYQRGDYIGISGLERFYENEMRGKKGVELVMVDVYNRSKGSYKNGQFDSAAQKGKDIYVTLDMELQKYGELLMNNKKGSIVAIEPSTGGVLALVSAPSYSPNLLAGKSRGKNYAKLNSDPLKPLFNRAVMAQYPPGSPFKLIIALIGLQEKCITPSSLHSCEGTATRPIRCSHNHISPVNLSKAIEVSCNPFFWKLFEQILSNSKYNTTADGFEKWREYVMDMGYGQRFNTDILGEKKGNIPTASYYDKYYKRGYWRPQTIRSLSIGQGELLATPLQLANMAAIIANKGYYYPPHLIDSIAGGKIDFPWWKNKHHTLMNPSIFPPIIEAMHKVFVGTNGTARFSNFNAIEMCGKTGTVENPHGADHSMFVAFAPKDNPKIAISVVVENSGFGSKWAVPIATLMIEKYLCDSISRPALEQKMIHESSINEIRK